MDNAKKIVSVLLEAGYDTYIVGGSVRDVLLKRSIGDIDIATAAHPATVMELAKKQKWQCLLVGKVFGVVLIKISSKAYEVATFRREGYGEDSHRPVWVNFAKTLTEDLARRDFTINALAMDFEGNIIDHFAGQDDIKRRTIKTVGEPKKRFAEDGLRIWRAVRFAAQLNFTIEEKTLLAMQECHMRCEGLSVERVANEINKILLSDYPVVGFELARASGVLDILVGVRDGKAATAVLPELVELYGIRQNQSYHRLDVWGHTLVTVQRVSSVLDLRWAALLHDIAKGSEAVRRLNKRGELSDVEYDKVGAAMAERIMLRLRQPLKLVKEVVWLVENHMSMPEANARSVVKWLRKLALGCNSDNFKERLENLWQLKEAYVGAGRVQQGTETHVVVKKILDKALLAVPFFSKQLSIDGNDILLHLSCKKQEIPLIQRNVLIEIQNGKLLNSKEAIINHLLSCKIYQEQEKNE